MFTFGLLAYEIAGDSAIEKEKHLLKVITKQNSTILANVYKENLSTDHFETHIKSGINSEHIAFLIDNKKDIIIPGKLTIAGQDYRQFPIKKILDERVYEGRLTFNKQLYLWVRKPIPESHYDLINIFRSSYEIHAPFASLAARLVVAGIIITWIAVWVALIISTTITRRLKTQNDALEHQALHDNLTDLPNRTLLHNRFEHAIRAAKQAGHEVAVIMMDLNRFKEINDTLGHHIGDLLLQQVGDRLSEALKETGTVSRFGGDEFAMLIPKTNLSQVKQVMSRVIKTLRSPFTVEDLLMEVDASFGIAFYPTHGEDYTTLIRCADVAMYIAKHMDKEFTIYDQDKDPHSLARLTLTRELRHAVDHDELVLHYQPKVDIKTGLIVCVEALMRWQHPQHGLIKPDNFILLAEQTGMIKSLTLWALSTAVKYCAHLHKTNYPLTVSVNLSASVLQDLRVPAQISAILKSHNLPPQSLELEITETAIMKDPPRALAIMNRLNHLGVRLSIDDFGTGYTCMSYLKQLPVDEIKIDKSFVSNMLKDENDTIIVNSIIDLAHNMGHKVTAEGVENQALFSALKQQNCDKAQGFYFSPALPEDKLEQFLS